MSHGYKSVIDCVDLWLPEPSTGAVRAMRHQRHVVMVGAATEIPRIKPSNPEMAEAIGIAQSLVHLYKREWYGWDWRDRANWLNFIEGRLKRETNAVDAAVRR